MRTGLATTTVYGKELAWIGNVIVDTDHRGKHIGQSLVEHAVSFLQKSGVRHIALYCYNEHERFYENLGFVKDSSFLRLRRSAQLVKRSLNQSQSIRSPPLAKIIEADRMAFGADRSKLIREVLRDKAGRYFGSGRDTSSASCLMVREYSDDCELGPWICTNPTGEEPGEMLSRALIMIRPVPVEVSCLSENKGAVHAFEVNDFRKVREGCRMFFERVTKLGNDRSQYALGFLDKG
jgi:predicted GNAT family acetyltransferase